MLTEAKQKEIKDLLSRFKREEIDIWCERTVRPGNVYYAVYAGLIGTNVKTYMGGTNVKENVNYKLRVARNKLRVNLDQPDIIISAPSNARRVKVK